jgi:transcription termination/antitermination protein NusG
MPDLETAEMETPELDAAEQEPEADDAETAEVETAELQIEEASADLPEADQAETAEVEAADLLTDEAPADRPEADVDLTEMDTLEMESDAPGEEQVAESTEDGVDADETASPVTAASPYDMPGDWYVIHSYSGYENKVKANLETRIQSMHMEDRIFEVHIPMEDVVEFKGGKKVTVPKKVFPGYILVRMTLDDDSWYAVRNTPGVTGFVAGNAQKPTPLSRREVERFLGVQEEEEKVKPRFKPEWEVGEQVRVVTGPFADFNGVIEDMNVDQQKIVVLVNIFGRDTPVELGFEDIQKS